jgi:predicted metalloprotease with PDZ domain
MTTRPIHYRISPASPEAHLFHVSLKITRPDPQGQQVALPAWIPGSYMIRDFARNIVRIRASCKGVRVALDKLDKHTWRAAPCAGPLKIEYEVYAWDLSVRAAHLDQSHGFFNGTSVFLRVIGQEGLAHEAEILPPAGRGYAAWQLATALPRARGTKAYAFGLYHAANYDELIDHPVEMGTFTLASFRACGVPHDIVITGRHDCDLQRLAVDLKKICEYQIRFFHGPRTQARDLPYPRYVFLTLALGEGNYGGLEHRASTALICGRNDLPYPGMGETTEGYRTFLGLASHEYFHTWNVKRIKPAAFTPYDLARENHTSLLWAFEGFTSYYDDLVLARTGLISVDEYLGMVARSARSVLRGTGRKKQTVAESSFDAWTKYYRQDENAPNAIVSYYAKGALVGLCLDLLLRRESSGGKSLDDVMRLLWREHGARGLGVPEDGIEAAAHAVGGAPAKRALTAFFNLAVRGTDDLPLKHLLAMAGIDFEIEAGASASLGARTAAAADGVKLTHVLDGGSAQRAGLSAGDVLIAVDGLKAALPGLEKLLGRKRKGAKVTVHAFRRDELIVREVTLTPGELDAHVRIARRAPAAARRRREAWLLRS